MGKAETGESAAKGPQTGHRIQAGPVIAPHMVSYCRGVQDHVQSLVTTDRVTAGKWVVSVSGRG